MTGYQALRRLIDEVVREQLARERAQLTDDERPDAGRISEPE